MTTIPKTALQILLLGILSGPQVFAQMNLNQTNYAINIGYDEPDYGPQFRCDSNVKEVLTADGAKNFLGQLQSPLANRMLTEAIQHIEDHRQAIQAELNKFAQSAAQLGVSVPQNIQPIAQLEMIAGLARNEMEMCNSLGALKQGIINDGADFVPGVTIALRGEKFEVFLLADASLDYMENQKGVLVDRLKVQLADMLDEIRTAKKVTPKYSLPTTSAEARSRLMRIFGAMVEPRK